MRGTYFRWTRRETDDGVAADILGSDVRIVYWSGGKISATVPDRDLDPDEARMIGVRLIEAATRAEADSSVRER
jgi:hypothetical protein